jgi:hypothetical protein
MCSCIFLTVLKKKPLYRNLSYKPFFKSRVVRIMNAHLRQDVTTYPSSGSSVLSPDPWVNVSDHHLRCLGQVEVATSHCHPPCPGTGGFPYSLSNKRE